MSTSSQLEDVWETYVFRQSDVQAFSTKYYFFDIVEDSESEVQRFFTGEEINFFQCLIVRGHRQLMTGVIQYDFTIQLSYYRTRSEDPSGANWTSVRDGLETLFDTAYTTLGATMQSTVDYWEPQEGPPQIDTIQIADEQVWRGIYTINATQQISI